MESYLFSKSLKAQQLPQIMEMAGKRCMDYFHRSRILGLRFSSTISISPAYAPSSPTPAPEAPEAPSSPTPAPSPPKEATTPSSAPISLKEAEGIKLVPSQLHQYNASTPPTQPQQTYTRKYFTTPPLHVWTVARFVEVPRSPYPEVCFVGRSNVGKSSLLNALFGRPNQSMARTSSKPGRTRTMNGFGVGGLRQNSPTPLKALGSGAIVVVDMPGYGKGSRREWGPEINKFFSKRKQLRKVFLLVDALHGVKPADRELLRHFKTEGIAYQVLLSKADRVLLPGLPGSKTPGKEKLERGLKALKTAVGEVEKELLDLDMEMTGRDVAQKYDILTCSAEKELLGVGLPRGRLGIDAVRWAVLTACGLDCDESGQKRFIEPMTVLDDDDF